MCHFGRQKSEAKIAQLGERMTEDHKVRCSIHLLGAFFHFLLFAVSNCNFILIAPSPHTPFSLFNKQPTFSPLFYHTVPFRQCTSPSPIQGAAAPSSSSSSLSGLSRSHAC